MQMLIKPDRKPASHLINLLKSTRAHHPNFTLFLGAGASAESNVKTANEMIAEWRDCYFDGYGKEQSQSKKDFLATQQWHGAPDEYSMLFEALYDQPSLRREYIEGCMENACPSWGYIYLVRLLEERVFNTVFTTNFDDLLNESCYLFSSTVRPILCAHDSSIRSVRMSSKRPKIIKLHGDFLFDSIKNTLRELESLEHNMRDKFRQYAGEFGMIFVGYSGRDRSIMDTIDALLRSESNFPHGIYWCVRKGSKLNEQVSLLQRFPKFHVIEISGFDSFFSILHAQLKLGPHPIFQNPYQVVSNRLGNLLERMPLPAIKEGAPPTELEDDISRLGATLVSRDFVARDLKIPYRLLTSIEIRKGNLKKATEYALKVMLEVDPVSKMRWTERFEIATEVLAMQWDDQLGEMLSVELQNIAPDMAREPYNTFNPALACMKHGKFELARKILSLAEKSRWSYSPLHEYYLINVAQIDRHEGKELAEATADSMRRIADGSSDPLSKFGALCVLGQGNEAVTALLSGGTKEKIANVLRWPISSLLNREARMLLEAAAN
jgi:hypothetical protein